MSSSDQENKQRDRKIAANEAERQTVSDIRVSGWAIAFAIIIGVIAVAVVWAWLEALTEPPPAGVVLEPLTRQQIVGRLPARQARPCGGEASHGSRGGSRQNRSRSRPPGNAE